MLQDGPNLRRQQRTFRRRILRLEIIAYLFHRDPLDALLRVELLDDPTTMSAFASDAFSYAADTHLSSIIKP